MTEMGQVRSSRPCQLSVSGPPIPDTIAGLLRAGRARPVKGPAAEKCDELTPLHTLSPRRHERPTTAGASHPFGLSNAGRGQPTAVLPSQAINWRRLTQPSWNSPQRR